MAISRDAIAGHMAYDEGLAHRLRDLTPAGAVEKRMFGGIGWMHRGHLLYGVLGEDLVARVGPDATDACLRLPGARPFDFTGRPMNGWVLVDQAALEEDEDLEAWVGRCQAFHATLPDR